MRVGIKQSGVKTIEMSVNFQLNFRNMNTSTQMMVVGSLTRSFSPIFRKLLIATVSLSMRVIISPVGVFMK
jgi:hypothetical protein